MKKGKRMRRFCLALLACWILLAAGCADKAPPMLPLQAGEDAAARRFLQDFLEQKPATALDADIRLSWDTLAGKGSSAAQLRMQRPAFLRGTLNDPLGRPLLIAVSDGRTFTLVDNRLGRAYQGKTASAFWRSSLPAALPPESLFFLLGGQLAPMSVEDVTPALDPDKEGFWYTWTDTRRIRHQALLAKMGQTGRGSRLARHLLFDAGGALRLDIRYTPSATPPDTPDCTGPWPGALDLTGKELHGSIRFEVEKIYSCTPMAPGVFRLDIPPHFSVEEVK